MKRLACLLLTLTACSTTDRPVPHIRAAGPSTSLRANALPDFGSAPAPRNLRQEPRKASRGSPRTPAPPSGDVWGRLAACESPTGRDSSSGKYHGYFQFSLTTWRAVGGVGDPHEHSYAVQLEMAQRLAARANPYTQWPVCWPRAVR